MRRNCLNILTSVFVMMSFTMSAQTLSSDKDGNILFTGTLNGADKDNFEVCRCLQEVAFYVENISATENEEDAKDGAFVKGSWSYHYFVDADDKRAGWIAFDFEYIIKDGTITYRFYNYVHTREEEDPVFESAGSLPAVWNEDLGKVFNKEQYSRIQKAITTSVRMALNSIKRHCLTE